MKNRWGRVLGVLVFTLAMVWSSIGEGTATAAKLPYLNWPTKRKTNWNITTISSEKAHAKSDFDLPKSGCSVKDKGYYTQGAVVTEYHYVFSYFCDNDANNNYIVFADKKSGKVVKKIKGNWAHMNSFYYDWGTHHVRVGGWKSKSACFKDAEKASDIKEVKIDKCKTEKSKDWGTPGVDVNGKTVENNVNQGRLTYQGEAMDGDYIYNAASDLNKSKYGQVWSKKKGINAFFVFDKDEKKLAKAFYLPEPAGELEDVSLDGDGNVYLWYNFGRGKKATYYKVNRTDLKLAKGKTGDSNGGKTSGSTSGSKNSGKNNSGGKNSGKNSGGSSSGGSSGGSGKSSSSGSGSGSGSGDSNGDGTGNSGEPETAILDTNTIAGVLDLVAEILAIGIPILGILGITIVGVQYMTAGGDEEKTRKAKRRMVEIVIGVIAYVVLYALFKFLRMG